jgi:predicted dinucleotide-binding enzyme
MSHTTIAVIGAGVIGRMLATRWAEAGHTVTFGARNPEGSDLVAFAQGVGASVAPINDAIASSAVVLLAVNGAAMDQAVSAMGPALDGKTVIDAANNIGGSTTNSLAVITAIAPTARVYRAFNSLGWENFADPVYGETAGDMLYSGPAGPTQDVLESLVADVGLRPVRVGDNDKIGLVDDFTRLWFTLAFEQGLGRGLGFTILTR